MNSRLLRSSLLSLLLVIPAAPASAQVGSAQRTEYLIEFPNPGTHEARVTATFRGLAQGRIVVRMSRSSPGRYAVHDFAKNVYSVTAYNGAGQQLVPTRPDPYSWSFAGHDGTIRFMYTVWGDRVDGTFLGVDQTHAHMNMPATFAWVDELDASPVLLTIRGRPGWRVATQLERTADSTTFRAPNLQYFLDSPTEAGPFTLREWTQPYGGRTPRYRIAVHHQGTEAQVDSFAAMVRRVIAEQHAVWGEPPAHDFGEYTFIVDYLPWASGDGMEHRNSTIVTSRTGTAPLADSASRLARLGTMSHELFHQWNVERLRPATLEPFNFTRANMSDALWFAEGFTQYYGPLTIRRAGLYTDEDFARQLGFIVATIESPARAYGSAADMSQRAPFVDAATSIDPTHHHNIFLSYYTWGAAIGAGLDLTLRTRFDHTLDEWLRVLWRDYGSQQTAALAPARPYTLADLRTSLGGFTGDSAFANDYFRRFIEGSQVVDYATLLARAGFLLEVDSVRPYLGGSLEADSATGGVFVNWTAANGSLFPAGVNNGDIILSVDGERVRTPEELSALVARRRVGELVRMEVIQRNGRNTVPVPLLGRASRRLVTFEAAGRALTAEQRAFRESWLGSKAN